MLFRSLGEAMKYFDKVSQDLNKIVEEIGVGDAPRMPATFYDTESEALGHKNNLDGLEKSLTSKIKVILPNNMSNTVTVHSEIIPKEGDFNLFVKIEDGTNIYDFVDPKTSTKYSYISKKIPEEVLSILTPKKYCQ